MQHLVEGQFRQRAVGNGLEAAQLGEGRFGLGARQLFGFQDPFALLLRALLFLDVSADAEPFDYPSLAVANRTGAAQEPTVASIRRPEAIFNLVGLAAMYR